MDFARFQPEVLGLTAHVLMRHCIVIFLCFLAEHGCSKAASGYDCSNGMWGETDEEQKWKFIPAVLKPAILVLSSAVPNDIPRARKPAFC